MAADEINLSNEELGAMAQALESVNKSFTDIIQKAVSLTTEMEKATAVFAKNNKNSEDRIRLLEKSKGIAEANGKLADNMTAIEQERIRQYKRQTEYLQSIGELTDDELITRTEILDNMMDISHRSEVAADNASQMALTLTGVSNAWEGTLIGSFFKGDFNTNMEKTVATLKAQFSAANMLGSALMRVQESTLMMVVSADAQFAEVNKLTNGTGEYNDMIMDTMANNQQYNVSVEDAGEAVKALYTEMSNFSNMSEEAQAQAVETTAQLKGLGIDAQTTAANFEIMTGALGMSSKAAGEAQKDFAAMAADLGVSAGKVAKDFERNASVFVAYGDDATEVFKEVAAAAKATGIEMDALLGITTQFDTFEGAAKAAGQLNAVLGGGLLNSMDLLNASEEERVRMLIQSIEMSGKSWQSMSKFEKQAIANAAGINDMTEANKMFGTSLAEYDANQRKVEDNAEAQKKLEERAAAAANMQDKLKRVMEQFAVAVTPIINVVHFLLDGLLSLNDMTGGMLIPTLVGLATAMMAIHHWSKLSAMWSTIMTGKAAIQAAAETGLAGAKGVLTGATAAQTAAAPAAASGSKLMAKGISTLGKAAAKAAPQLVAILAPIGSIAAAVAAPILLMAVIIWSIKELVIAFLEMPDAIAPALLGLMGFILIAAWGLPVLGAAIAGFFNALLLAEPAMVALAPVLPTMVASFLGLALALYILGKAIQEFVGPDMPGAMMLTLASLLAFGIGLGIVEEFIGKNAWKVGVAVGILGLGLIFLGKGVKEFNDVTWPAIGFMMVSLILMGVLLKRAAKFIEMPAWKVGVAAGILGAGLMLLGMGVKAFNDVSIEALGLAIVTLAVFGAALTYIVVPTLGKGALLVGAAAILLAVGLMLLAKGITEFNDIGMGQMIGLPIALAIFGLALIPAGVGLAIGGTFLLYGALVFWPASKLLVSALKPWLEFFPHMETLRGLGGALRDMTRGMPTAGFKLLLGSWLLLAGAVAFRPASRVLTKSLIQWVPILPHLEALSGLGMSLLSMTRGMPTAGLKLLLGSWLLLIGAVAFRPASRILTKTLLEWVPILPHLEALSGLGMALLNMTHGMITAGIKMLIAGIFLGPGALLIGVGLKALAWGLEPWMDGTIDYAILPTIGGHLWDFAIGMFWAGLALAASAPAFIFGAVLMGIGLLILNKPLAEFADTLAVLAPIAPALPVVAEGFRALGKVLPGFGWGILKLGIAASMPFFKTGLKTLSKGLRMFASAMAGIPEEKAKALGSLFEGLEKFSNLKHLGLVLRKIGWGIWWIGNGLKNMPEGVQAVQFSVAAESLAMLAEASVDLTPESVENVQDLADAAIDYGIASRLMRSAGQDALVSALRELAGLAKNKGKDGASGQDIVLEIDGKEFARAVSAAIDSKHNMPF